MAAAVIDASVLTSSLVDSTPDSIAAIEACRPYDELIAPSHVDVECVSAWRSMVRRGDVSLAVALDAVVLLAQATITRADVRPLLPRIWELGHNVTPYDAAYIALAESLDVPFLTRDGRAARAAGARCQFVLV